MTHAWVTLTAMDGEEVEEPTDEELAEALAHLYGSPAAAEPAVATLRFGYDDGLMYVAEISAGGDVVFEEWSDRDCEIALAGPRRMRASQADALALWCSLARRQVNRIRELAWQSGP
jgi:hypothetical protein